MRYLGIDGGGSKTKFLLVDEYYNELSQVQSGPSNWLSVGADTARAAISEGVANLSEKPDVVCAGFAGAARPESLTFYKEVLQSLLPGATIIIESDAFIASIGAIGIDPGVLLIAGTGSIVIGRDKDRSMFRVGGWGPYFGDEGSGFWIGREAVRAALRSKDSQGRPEFSDRVAQSLGLKSIPEVVAAWATGKVGVPEIAGLFPEVVSLYPAEPSNRILNEAASHLRSLVEVAAKRVGVDDCRKSLSGSVAAHPIMRQLVGLKFEEPRHSPEWGAVIWARQHFANPL
ncbi:MAG TPA: BadF/BadG/BcrA/BcrD ATPase family protein [Terriglobia bacterium]|nr:BadF/BadG/BcrA/BcrD ATPase family protein [Terriglobia bacterium]